MADLIIILILLAAAAAAVSYIVKAKKRGVKCIGCSAASSCPHRCSGSSCRTCGGSEKMRD